MIVSVSDFNSFLKKILSEKLLSIQEIIVPSRSNFINGENLFFKLLKAEDRSIDPGNFRTVDPAKLLFYLPRQKVLPSEYKVKKRLVLGLKSCDINALAILDTALTKSGFTDPAYQHWRENTIIISSDCRSFLPNCFCSSIGNQPYAEKGFDLNLSKVDDQYMISLGSPKGEELLTLMKKHIAVYSPSPEIIEKVKRQREELKEKLDRQIQIKLNSAGIELPAKAGQDNSEDNLWKNYSKNCVGCGACTNICPTCYCLILNDESSAEEFVKVRTYDSCQLNGYARVAGGGTPRPKIHQRFRNRVLCKFSYMKSNFNLLGCTGCGRCMDVCSLGYDFILLGKIVLDKTAVKADSNLINNSFEVIQRA